MRGRKHKCAISFLQQCIATRSFIPLMNPVLNESSDPVFQRSIWSHFINPSFIHSLTPSLLKVKKKLTALTAHILSETTRDEFTLTYADNSKYFLNYCVISFVARMAKNMRRNVFRIKQVYCF